MRRHPKRLGGSPGVEKLHAALLGEHHAAERAVQQSGARQRAIGLLSATRAEILKAGPRAGKRDRAKAVEAGVSTHLRTGGSRHAASE